MAKILTVFLLIALMPSSRVLADEACVVPVGTSAIPKSLQSILSASNTSNIKEFCDQSVYEGVGQMNLGKSAQEMDALMNNEQATYNVVTKKGGTAWSYSLLPNTKLRELTYHDGEVVDFKKAKELVEKPLSPLSQNEIDDIKKGVNDSFSWFELPTSEKKFNNVYARSAACLLVTREHFWRCQKAAARAVEIMHQAGEYTLRDENLEILTDEKYRAGLRNAALVLMAKAESKDVPSGDLFSDIESGFLKAGFSEKQSNDMTWTAIAVISAGGPNYLYANASSFGKITSNEQTKLALDLIARAIPLLNQKTRETGHFYSYPPGVQSTCDNGKSYHFWMAAYLSRRLTQELGSPEGAAAAVFTMQKGYEFLSDSTGRNPRRALTVDTFDGFNNIMRIDMTYAAAGAKYGVLAAQGRRAQLDIDDGLRSVVKNSQVTPSLSKNEVDQLYKTDIPKAYYLWSERMAPSAAFDYFNN